MTTPTTQREADERTQLRADKALLLHLRDAVGKLIKAKGRYHTEQNYGALVAAYDLSKPAAELTRQAAPEAPAGEQYIPRDWPEDAAHENGNYQCRCSTCGHTFMGYKRRTTCKACAHPAATDQPSAGQVDERAQDGWAPMPTEAGMYWRCDPVNGADFPPSIVEVVVSPGGPLCTVAHNAELGFGFKGDKFYPINAGPSMWLKIEQPSTPSHSKQPIAFSCSRRAEAGPAAWSQTCESHCGDNNLCPAARASLTPTAPQAASQQAADLMTIRCPACVALPGLGCDECHGQGEIIVSRKDMAALAAQTTAAPQAATTAACQPSTLTGQPDAAICQPAATSASASIYGYAVEQADGHITFFKDDPTGFRHKKWADVGTVVRTLYVDDLAALARAPLPAKAEGTARRLRDLAAGRITGEIPAFEYSLAADRIQDLEGLLEQAQRAAQQDGAVDVARDAARFAQAIALEDSAEALYAAVMSNAPDSGAIRREFDAAMSRTNTSGGSDAD